MPELDSLDDLQGYLNGMVGPEGSDEFSLAFPVLMDSDFLYEMTVDSELSMQPTIALSASDKSTVSPTGYSTVASGDADENQSRTTTRSSINSETRSIPTTAFLPDLCTSSNSIDYSFLGYNDDPTKLLATHIDLNAMLSEPMNDLLPLDPHVVGSSTATASAGTDFCSSESTDFWKFDDQKFQSDSYSLKNLPPRSPYAKDAQTIAIAPTKIGLKDNQQQDSKLEDLLTTKWEYVVPQKEEPPSFGSYGHDVVSKQDMQDIHDREQQRRVDLLGPGRTSINGCQTKAQQTPKTDMSIYEILPDSSFQFEESVSEFAQVSVDSRNFKEENHLDKDKPYKAREFYEVLVTSSCRVNVAKEIVQYLSNRQGFDSNVPYIKTQSSKKTETKRSRKHKDVENTNLGSINKIDDYIKQSVLYSMGPDEVGGQMTGQYLPTAHVVQLCIALIENAITKHGGQEFLTVLDEKLLGYSSTVDVSNNGIPFQIDPTTGERLSSKSNAVFQSRWSDQEISDITASWKSSSRRSDDNIFRPEDKRTTCFTIYELCIAIKCITSRPPRRINRYPAYQLGTHRSIGKDQLVTDWGHKISCNSHCTSNDTRIVKQTNMEPPNITVSKSGSLDLEEDDAYRPYRNIKKQPGNLYDATWFVAEKQYKEALCDHCAKSQYYRMKNSGYLYHKNYEHGIFPNGNIFEDPLIIRRKMDRESKWEGLCGICYYWIELEHTSKPWGTWYRHYKQCVNEYELFKKALQATGAPVKLVEILYKPY